MEVLTTIENFEEGGGKYRVINSPRSLEACLRSGLDPAELYPKSRNFFKSKDLSKEMLEIKIESYDKKRNDKIEIVRNERNKILSYAEKKKLELSMTSGVKHDLTATAQDFGDKNKGSAMLEMEERRMEALRRRQEKELNKIIEREQTMAELQLKIKRAEEEEIRKKKLHEKKVAESKAAEEKKKAQMVLEAKQLELEEAEKKRELARKEAEVEEKIKKNRLKVERQIAKEARMRDEERKMKVEEYRKKTESLIKAQEDLAERNRLKMLEREARIMSQLEEKKEQKRQEVQKARDEAQQRIEEALHKHHELHEAKKAAFDQNQREAAIRAKENAILERERLKKQADDRDKRNTTRLGRLIDAYKTRREHRDDISNRRAEKDKGFDRIKEQRDAQTAMLKFSTDLKLQDKQDNVERIARVNEFRRLQTLQKIEAQDLKYATIQFQRRQLMEKHNEEAKQSLIRKYEISDAMERMRMTNDFTLLDKLFEKKKKDKKSGKGDDEEDPRLAQTI